MPPFEEPPRLALRIGRVLLLLAGAAAIVWLALRALASVHNDAGV